MASIDCDATVTSVLGVALAPDGTGAGAMWLIPTSGPPISTFVLAGGAGGTSVATPFDCAEDTPSQAAPASGAAGDDGFAVPAPLGAVPGLATEIGDQLTGLQLPGRLSDIAAAALLREAQSEGGAHALDAVAAGRVEIAQAAVAARQLEVRSAVPRIAGLLAPESDAATSVPAAEDPCRKKGYTKKQVAGVIAVGALSALWLGGVVLIAVLPGTPIEKGLAIERATSGYGIALKIIAETMLAEEPVKQ